jgi:hypothetical protein
MTNTTQKKELTMNVPAGSYATISGARQLPLYSDSVEGKDNALWCFLNKQPAEDKVP